MVGMSTAKRGWLTHTNTTQNSRHQTSGGCLGQYSKQPQQNRQPARHSHNNKGGEKRLPKTAQQHCLFVLLSLYCSQTPVRPHTRPNTHTPEPCDHTAIPAGGSERGPGRRLLVELLWQLCATHTHTHTDTQHTYSFLKDTYCEEGVHAYHSRYAFWQGEEESTRHRPSWDCGKQGKCCKHTPAHAAGGTITHCCSCQHTHICRCSSVSSNHTPLIQGSQPPQPVTRQHCLLTLHTRRPVCYFLIVITGPTLKHRWSCCLLACMCVCMYVCVCVHT